VWEAFGTWVSGYYLALRAPVDLIGRARTANKDPLIMHEFEWLYDATQSVDHRLSAGSGLDPEQEHDGSRYLLQREAELDGGE